MATPQIRQLPLRAFRGCTRRDVRDGRKRSRSLLLALTGCATCREHPVACAVAVASVRLRLDGGRMVNLAAADDKIELVAGAGFEPATFGL